MREVRAKTLPILEKFSCFENLELSQAATQSILKITLEKQT